MLTLVLDDCRVGAKLGRILRYYSKSIYCQQYRMLVAYLEVGFGGFPLRIRWFSRSGWWISTTSRIPLSEIAPVQFFGRIRHAQF